ncbi:sensor histidine kinase [Microvirga thermotolerans]|uniref:sensor histidine kinase n=1 Tax=Microvirga thermotolerans TaxID=2651334 RepID=UPI001883E0E9|nr:HWE histidine kinase domain-containing protein [Microvirga thermotolerans]
MSGTPSGEAAAGSWEPWEAEVEQRLATVLEEIGTPFIALDAGWRFMLVNRAAETYYGVPRQAMLGRRIWDLFPDTATALRPPFEKVLATGEHILVETDPHGRSAAARPAPFSLKAFPYRGGVGVSFSEWSAQRRAEEVLRESQEQLSALADNLPLGVVYQMNDALGFEGRRFLYISASCERLNGVPAEQALDNPLALFDLILPEYREEIALRQYEAHRDRKPFDIEFPIRHAKTGEIRWQRIVDAPRRLPNGSYVWDGLQIDITDHKNAEEHLKLLINELNHRVKNTLATVQSLAAQSFARLDTDAGGPFAKARQAFEARLFALARGHDVLTRENWKGAHLSDIVHEAFAPYRHRAEGSEAITACGPDRRVPPAVALSLSMAIHELCTNALKYGALKAPAGHVRVTWSISGEPPSSRLRLRWEESGGPPVRPPAQKGFGSRLIEEGLARELNGTVHLDFREEGVVCTVDVPLE